MFDGVSEEQLIRIFGKCGFNVIDPSKERRKQMVAAKDERDVHKKSQQLLKDSDNIYDPELLEDFRNLGLLPESVYSGGPLSCYGCEKKFREILKLLVKEKNIPDARTAFAFLLRKHRRCDKKVPLWGLYNLSLCVPAFCNILADSIIAIETELLAPWVPRGEIKCPILSHIGIVRRVFSIIRERELCYNP